jgi:hypothetical protein
LPEWEGQPSVTEEVTKRMMIKGQPDSLEDWVQMRPTVLHVHTEAGHGDNIAMLRYLPLLVERGYTVRYECDPLLLELAKVSLPGIEVIPRAVDYPGALGLKPFDYHIPIGDLPHVFGTDIDTVPWRGPYLQATAMRTARYAREAGRGARPQDRAVLVLRDPAQYEYLDGAVRPDEVDALR